MLLSDFIKRPSKQAARQQPKQKTFTLINALTNKPELMSEQDILRMLERRNEEEEAFALPGRATLVPFEQAIRRDLKPNEQTVGFGEADPYIVKRHWDGSLSCSCPAWWRAHKKLKRAEDRRDRHGKTDTAADLAAFPSCKHTKLFAAEGAPRQQARQQTPRQQARQQPRRQATVPVEGGVVSISQASRRGLERGEQTEVQGSGSKPYIVKRHLDGVLSCSCPAWRNKGGPAGARSCKHTALIAAEGAPRQQARQQARAPRQQAPALLSDAIRPQPASQQRTTSRARSGDPLGGGVLLAEKWKPDVDPTGCHMSEKLDGVRAYWNGEGLYSRNGNRFAAPAWFTEMLPSDTSLDGELYVGPGKFNEAVSIVRTAVPDDARWRSIRYMVFDMPDSPLPFEGRMDALDGIIATACRGKRSCPIVKVAQTVCRGPEHLGQFHKRVTAQGIEGTMLRKPGSSYERRRSSTLLKVKDFHDAEARIVGTYAGEGKHRGRIGGYEAVDEQTGVRFRVGTGLTDRQRENPLPVGARITYRFQERTPSGAPRFPSFVAARDYE